MTAAVEARGLSRSYRGRNEAVAAVVGVDVTLAPGEVLAIVGRSGSGKTTLLQLIGLLLRADAGELRIAGMDVSGADDDGRAELRRQHLGFVFQSFNLLPQLTALDNVRIARPHESDATARATELLRSLDLSHRLHHRPAELSAGEQQRVAIARAWINDPSVLLADEPTGNLDEARQGEVLDLLYQAAQRGQAVLVVTHAREVAARAHRVLVMRDGRLEPPFSGMDTLATSARDGADT